MRFIPEKIKPLNSRLFSPVAAQRLRMPVATPLGREAAWALGSTPGHPARSPAEPKHRLGAPLGCARRTPSLPTFGGLGGGRYVLL